MNKEELEKMFDEKFCNTIEKGFIDYDGTSTYMELKEGIDNEKIKQFIFETVIPEVLKSIMFRKTHNGQDMFLLGYNSYVEDIKQKAKELLYIN